MSDFDEHTINGMMIYKNDPLKYIIINQDPLTQLLRSPIITPITTSFYSISAQRLSKLSVLSQNYFRALIFHSPY